jgi:hypothetical protein
VRLEWWDGTAQRTHLLGGERVIVGSSTTCDVVVDEPSVSRVHVVLQRVGDVWLAEDCGSRNGTLVNGQKMSYRRAVHVGDQVRIGRVTLRLGGEPSLRRAPTETVAPMPLLTGRERDVLVALCGPLADGDVFTEPQSVREIAAELVVTDAAVKQHLANLYDKFAVTPGERRRSRLANAALDCAAVTLADLRLRAERLDPARLDPVGLDPGRRGPGGGGT